MTRINCIPVEELTNLHLLAEYREMPRISSLIWKWYDKTYSATLNTFVHPTIPRAYCLGAGHVKFFYNKGLYLQKRFEAIVQELTKRGYNLQYTTYQAHPPDMNHDWVPTIHDQNINRMRIQERLNKHKPA